MLYFDRAIDAEQRNAHIARIGAAGCARERDALGADAAILENANEGALGAVALSRAFAAAGFRRRPFWKACSVI